MSQYSQDHRFSQAVSECFRDIGEHQFVNPISSYPWGGRSRIVGRIRVFEKYLKGEDVLHARWLQNQAMAADPSNWRSREVGIEYLNKLMAERSGGTFEQEMDDIASAQPSLMGYMEQEFGSSAELAAKWRNEQVQQQRGQMHLVKVEAGGAVAGEGVSKKAVLNDVVYVESRKRGDMYHALRKEASLLPEYIALEAKVDVAIGQAQAQDLLIKSEALRLFAVWADKHGGDDLFFEGVDAAKRDGLRVAQALQLFRQQAELNVGASKWAEVNLARSAPNAFVIAYFDKHMPPENPHSDSARQQRGQQDTDQFKRWFEGSKVVTKAGAPIIAFHGTAATFDEFVTGDDEALRSRVVRKRHNPDYGGLMGAWFTAPSKDNSGYDEGNAECICDGFCSSLEEDTGFKEGACVIPVYLNIKNPMEFEGFEDFQDARDEYPSQHAFKQAMLEDGHDGFVIRDCYTDGDAPRDDWVAFYPHQVKSAIGNSGSFDLSASLTDQAPRYLVVDIADTATAAFEDVGRNAEIARIVSEACAAGTSGTLCDLNGNDVGEVMLAACAVTEIGRGRVQVIVEADIAARYADKIGDLLKGGTAGVMLTDDGQWLGVVHDGGEVAQDFERDAEDGIEVAL